MLPQEVSFKRVLFSSHCSLAVQYFSFCIVANFAGPTFKPKRRSDPSTKWCNLYSAVDSDYRVVYDTGNFFQDKQGCNKNAITVSLLLLLLC